MTSNHHPLRQYQSDSIAALRESMRQGHRRIVLQGSTGSGKTRIAAEIIRMAHTKHNHCLMIAPRRELIFQAVDALSAQGLDAGIIMAGETRRIGADVQVASFDTLHARGMRSKRMKMPRADLVIVDEVHLALAKTRMDIMKHYGDARIIGLTATPARGDGRGLGEFFHDMVLGPSIKELVRLGHLAPMRYFAPSQPDLENLRLNKDGDYVEKSLGERMNNVKLIGDIVANWKRIAPDRQTVVFCVNRAHSRAVCEEYVRHGIRAEHLDGETPHDERMDILNRIESGETQVLCNVYVATYGLDLPCLSCIVLARPTKNITLYLQTVGRGMRTYPGKDDCIVIDHSGAVAENGFADEDVPWSLDGEEKVKDRKKKQQEAQVELKTLECIKCHYTFKGSRICPACGFELLPPSKALPVHEADLQEMKQSKAKKNRDLSWPEKIEIMGSFKQHAADKGYKPGWAAMKYKAMTGVWPNDARVKHAPPCPMNHDAKNWLTHERIAYAKRRQS